MDSGSSCLCDSSETTDPTEYLEALKQKYLARTAKLQAQQQALERKIMTMETFIAQPVPKVFPDDAPVRDTPTIPKIINDQQPMTQQCSFFQKMMENARSILSMKCQCPSAVAKSTSVTPTAPTTTSSEPPTRDNDQSTQENVVDYDLTDKSSRTSTCTCEFTDPSTLQDFSCTCNMTDSKPKSQQVSNELSSSTPKQPESKSKSKSSDLISGDCSCEVCQCDSMLTVEELPATVPTVSVFKGSALGGTQATVVVDDKSLQAAKDTASKCVTCCRTSSCPNKPKSSAAGETVTSAGVQVASLTKNRAVNIQLAPTVCKAPCNTDLGPDRGAVTAKDNQNQCAFVGSPLLDFPQGSSRTKLSSKKSCTNSGFSLTSNDILEMQNIAELAKKEKQMKAQIKELQRREKQYQETSKNVETLSTKCCDCGNSAGISAEIDKISRELRLENKVLKSDLEGLKLELKHCLEKVEGPMKQKLQTEKMKCENLQKDLQAASKNMVISQDAYSREMNQLKMQLCCACTNITELNQMNQRLKDEMSQLDCLCQKLEDDLMKQKINEAETIKRLTNRKVTPEAQTESFKCDSNLDVIARKLSKTLKDLGPCEECSKLPAELAGAARCIKELTDMVRKRRTKSSSVSGCCCQGPQQKIPPPEDDGECCTCCGPREGAGEPVKTILDVPKSFVKNDESSKFDMPGGQSSYFSAKGEAPCAGFGIPCAQGKSKPVQVPSKLDQSCSCKDPEGKQVQVPEDAAPIKFKSESVTPSQDESFVTTGDPDTASGQLTSGPVTESAQEPTLDVTGDLTPKELPPDKPEEGLVEIPVEEKRYGGDFPYEVETKGYAMSEPPTDLHITTAITGSGTLEVITEGPEGVIATRLTYTEEGNIEVVTEMTEEEAQGEAAGMEKFATQPLPGVPYEASSVTFAEEPASDKLEFMAVASSNISGLSGPQAESPYTESSATAVGGELTSKLGSDSSGLKPELEGSAELTSGFGETTRLEVGPEAASGETEELETTKEEDLQQAIRDGVPSEGATSTAGELKSGDIFTPDQVTSDYEEGIVAVKSLEGSAKSTDLELPAEADDLVKEEPELETVEVKVEPPEEVEEEAGEVAVEEAVKEEEPEQPPEIELPEAVTSEEIEEIRSSGEPPTEKLEEESAPTTIPTEEGDQLTGEGAPEVGALVTRDCSCQSRDKTDQSCQCCECKTVGVTTSGDKETITETMGQTPEEPLDGTKTDTDSEFITISEATTENAVAEEADSTKPDDTTVITSEHTEEVVEPQPPAEPVDQEVLMQVDYTTPKPSSVVEQPSGLIEVNEEMLAKHPELQGKTPSEQQAILRELGYVAAAVQSKAVVAGEPEMTIRESLLQKHPELQGKTPSEQLKILQSLGYTSDEIQAGLQPEGQQIRGSLLEKYPELQGKTPSEQKRILKELGYQEDEMLKASKVAQQISGISPELLQKHPELQGKTPSQQKAILRELGYQEEEINEDLLTKHPELQGKTPSEQRRILLELGYPEDEIQKAVAAKVPSWLQKHPELAQKTPSEQRKALEELGYTKEEIEALIQVKPSKPKILVDQELLNKHPELVGKSSEEQQRILRELGYTAPTDIQEMLRSHPELAGLSLEEQKAKLESMGYIMDAVLDSVISQGQVQPFQSALMQQPSEAPTEPFSTPEPSSRDVSITCKAPCRTAAVPSEPKVSKRVSSREVSVTCKASCRSAATLHSITPKGSRKEVVAVGDVSVTSLSKSRSVSLQQRPSSRDDSASCKASCRTISVQSSTGKPSKQVESNSTSSSSSEKHKKGRSGEVPSIVYELSDKERPVVETPRKYRSTKKRRIRVIDCLKCYCNDPCNCVVCTPERNRRPLNQNVRSCHCPPHITQRPVQTSFSMPPTGHAPNCKCDACVCIPPSNLESPTTDDAEGKKLKHPSSCECVDCLCLPKVKKLARTREYPIVYDKKQVYQVKVKCGSCVNAQNARRYVEQTRSRIPISTSSSNPPRSRQEPSEGAPPPPSATQSDYQSIVCDCQNCVCTDCPDESKKKPGAKNQKGCCCKASVCTCDPCAIDELAKRLKEAEEKLSAAPAAAAAAPPTSEAPPPPSGAAPAAGAPDEPCNCPVCLCPGKDQMPPAEGAAPPPAPSQQADAAEPPADGAPPSSDAAAPSGGDGGHPPDCDCTECVCPGLEDYKAGKSQAPKQESGAPSGAGAGGDEDCNCDVCACPGSKTPGAATAAPTAALTCDCNECKCSPCGDPAKKPPAPPDGGVADCDCADCKCNPCADPKKRKSCPTDGAGAAHSDICDCPECSCPATKGAKAGLTNKLSQFTDMPEKVPHPPDCDCTECMCLEEIIQTELVGLKEQGVQPAAEKEVHAAGCACPECLCPECTMKSVHAMGCQCGTCVCSPCEKGTGDQPPARAVREDHPEGCSCIKCMCDVCPSEPKTDGAPSAAKPAGEEPHGDNCKCVECLCKECFMKLAPLKHEEGCQCPQCVCVECLKKMQQGDFQVGAKPEENKRGPNCTCEHCICIDCGGKGASASTGTQPSPDGTCSCAPCQCKPCFSKAQPPEEECTCQLCTCVICTKKRKEPAQPLKEEKATHSKGCTCKVCACEGPEVKAAEEGKGEGQSMDPPPFEPFKRIDCNCIPCQCIICAPQAGGPLRGSGVPDFVPPPFEPPVRIDCICKRCSCIFCNKDAPRQRSVAAQPSTCETKPGADLKKAVSVQQPSQSQDPPPVTKSAAGHAANCQCPECICKPCPLGGPSTQLHCNCPTCQCKPCKFKEAESFVSAKGSAKPSGGAPPDGLVHCNCPTCTCGEGVIKTTALDKSGPPSKIAQKSTTGEVYQSAETLVLPKPDVRQMFPDHPPGCNCAKCDCKPCPDPQMKKLDNVTLVKSIQAANKENCECREQIEEIKKTLEKIRCACTEAEFRSTQSMGQTMGKDMTAVGGKPFVKQASAFGQTMSGLKMALNNLQAKCTAKDRMIEAMTTELTVRGTPDVFDKVLDVSVKIPKPLDYDQAEDVKSAEFKHTHVIYPPVQTKDRSTAAIDLKKVASKCVEVRTHKHKKKKKAEDCECENPPITQRQEKDCQKVDLAGFEVIDIRRITDDSLIVKWNCPANDLVQGYDIYVNGTVATKVMSGTRTSAMMHSLDLSKSVQITIYAVTKCGRVEPPAIAIYEIKANPCGCK